VLDPLKQESKLDNLDALELEISSFFTLTNPHYLCLNENQFRAHLRSLNAREDREDSQPLSKPDRYLIVDLVNLMRAEVRLVCRDVSDSGSMPS
jgi:hypothetical protein